MGKLLKGVVKFTVAAAAVGGVCYAFKDKIKQSKFYQEYDVDTKIDKVKTAIKEKVSSDADEKDIVEDDELFFDDAEAANQERDYVSIQPEAETKEETDKEEAEADVPTIDV